MDASKAGLVLLVITDTECGRRDDNGRCLYLTADQLDALVDFGWHLPDLRARLETWAQAVRTCWRSRVSHQIAFPTRPSAATTARE